jgi:glucosamine--fructose-6-phosphate aminotransferase (isomerizing)
MIVPATTRMRREIGQAPGAVDRIIARASAEVAAAAAAIKARRPTWVTIVARGTSDHAAVYARYLIETQLGLPTALAAASVTTIYDSPMRWDGGLVLAISQSGRSDDLVTVLSRARTGGAVTIAITNDDRSPLARSAEWSLRCHAGRELAIPATKTYVAELAVVAALVGALDPAGSVAAGLPRVGAAVRHALEVGTTWIRGSEGAAATAAFAAAERALVVSRGYNLATALEIALKFKETSAIFAEAYSTADFAHGPIALAAHGIPVLAIRPDGPIGTSIDRGLQAASDRGAEVWIVGGGEARTRQRALGIELDLPEALTPLAYVIPCQLLVEAVTRRLGRSPDAPSGLRKVTRTR